MPKPQPKSAYKTVEVSAFDLARLLDWCENSTMPLQSDGSTIGICDVAWYRDAYDTVNRLMPRRRLIMPKQQPKSAYKTVEVSAFDLARLLDWCESSSMQTSSGSAICIHDMAWYREAYVTLSDDLIALINRGGWSR